MFVLRSLSVLQTTGVMSVNEHRLISCAAVLTVPEPPVNEVICVWLCYRFSSMSLL